MKADFRSDLRRIFASILTTNADADARQDIQNMNEIALVVCYLNWRKRIIDKKPRRLIESREFDVTKRNPAYADRVGKLLAKIQNGSDLAPHLSKRIKHVYTRPQTPRQLGKRPDLDLLLNDWGIHHLHISDEMEPGNTGFVKRDGPLMYAIFFEDRVYLIDILGHGDFANDNLIRILVHNWPNDGLVIKLNGILPGTSPTMRERSMLRSAGVDTIVNLDGSAYLPGITMGLTSAGTSMRAVQEAQRFVRVVRQAELDFQDDGAIRKLYADIGMNCPDDVELRLSCLSNGDETIWGIMDVQSSTLLRRIW